MAALLSIGGSMSGPDSLLGAGFLFGIVILAAAFFDKIRPLVERDWEARARRAAVLMPQAGRRALIDSLQKQEAARRSKKGISSFDAAGGFSHSRELSILLCVEAEIKTRDLLPSPRD
jgi:preprotein translocase subunit Sec61beta